MRILKEENDLPWCVIGDLNNVLSQDDKRGCNPYPNWLIDGSQQTVFDCNLVDLELEGHPFTWEKSKGTDIWIEVRLDRALATPSWMSLFSNAQLINMVFSTSDHCPLFLDPSFQFQTASRRVFRFENAWLRDSNCYAIIQEQWEACVSGNIIDKVAALQGPFGRLDVESLAEYKEARKQLAKIYHKKEIFWRQRSKQLWLREGDQNTRYFYAATSSRRKNNFIHELKDETGSWVHWGSGLSQVMVDYYTDIFHSKGSNYAKVLDVIQPSITYEDNVALLQPVLEEEVRHAVFQMHPNKSPGPDGLTPAFYQKCWHIVGKDVVKMV
uniref:Endonuclease/exonuclease/phosphatase family protein n=1 Tax=Cannabis sativa TaxID=3483 RepID=A0A803NXE1_CANSA